MADRIEALRLDSSFIDPSIGTKTSSHLTNKSNLSMDTSHTDKALKEFTERTGIPLVVVVNEDVNVFGKTQNGSDWFTVILSLALIGLAIYLIVRNILDRRQAKKNGGNGNNGNNGGGYYDAGTGNYYSNQ